MDDTSKLLEREQAWVDTFNSHTNGYNANPKVENSKGRKYGKVTRRRVSDGARRVMNDPEIKVRHKAATLKAMQDPEVRKRTSEAAKKRWNDPAYRSKMLATRADPEVKKRALQKIREGKRKWIKSLSPQEKQKFIQRLGDQSSKYYIVTTPDGSKIVIKNLKQFCREKNLSYSNASKVVENKVRRTQGYHFARIEGAAHVEILPTDQATDLLPVQSKRRYCKNDFHN